MNPSTQPKLKILSIDGGGIRGIIPCVILQEIENRMQRPISSIFHLIAGTSTGGIITVGLTIPDERGLPKYDAKALMNLYAENGDQIFQKRLFKTARQIFYPGYTADSIEGLLKTYFGDWRLKDALTDVLVTSLNTQNLKPFYFLSRLAKQDARQPSENFLMREVARSTSAAPTYFPANGLNWGDAKDTMSLVDGGVFANNPSVLAFTEAIELARETKSKDIDAVVTPDADASPFFMLSLGTGQSEKSIPLSRATKMGMLPWIWKGRIINMVMHGVSESTHYQMQYVLPDYPDGTKRYARINPTLWTGHEEMDDVSTGNINALIDMGKQAVKDNTQLLDQICERLQA